MAFALATVTIAACNVATYADGVAKSNADNPPPHRSLQAVNKQAIRDWITHGADRNNRPLRFDSGMTPTQSEPLTHG